MGSNISDQVLHNGGDKSDQSDQSAGTDLTSNIFFIFPQHFVFTILRTVKKKKTSIWEGMGYLLDMQQRFPARIKPETLLF